MTLVEVMAAILILGLIMMAMARTLITSLSTVQAQERQVHASAIVSEVLEQAHGVDFRSAGLCKTPATAYFGAGNLNHTYTDENPPHALITQPMVLIRDDAPYCDVSVAPLGPPTLQPSQVMTRRGVPYTLRTVVSWFDDPSDGLAGADPDGPEDMKHVVVTATWPVRDSTRSMTTETYLAPVHGEQPLTTSVTSLAAGSPPYTYLDDSGVSESGIHLVARALEPQNIVKVRWLRRDGTSTGWIDMVNPSSDRVTWTFTIQPGAAGNPYNRFPNGETIFEFESTDPVLQKWATFNRGLFVHTTPDVLGLIADPNPIQVDESGNVCPFEIRMSGWGLLPTDVTTITFADGSPDALAFPSGTPTVSGSDFTVRIDDEPSFVPGVDETVTVAVQRVNDAKTDAATLDLLVSPVPVPTC